MKFRIILLIVSVVTSLFFYKEFILTDDFLRDYYSNQMDASRIENYIDYLNRFKYIEYVLSIVIMLLQMLLVSISIKIGCLFKNYKINTKHIFQLSINSQFIVVFYFFISSLYLYFSNDYTSTPPFSVLALFKPTEIEPWLRYPFSLLNIFEVFYWVALIVQWKKLTGKTYGESFDFIGSTYGLGLLLWVLVVVFFTI